MDITVPDNVQFLIPPMILGQTLTTYVCFNHAIKAVLEGTIVKVELNGYYEICDVCKNERTN